VVAGPGTSPTPPSIEQFPERSVHSRSVGERL